MAPTISRDVDAAATKPYETMGDTDVAMSDVSVAASGSSVSVGMDWEPIKRKLMDVDATVALEAAQELRERLEIVHTTEFPRMLSSLLPAFSSVLSHLVRPNADTTSTEHKVRNSVLEVLSRLPNNEVLRPHATQILTVAMDVLLNDYEDNALLASRIIFDLHKNYRQMPQDQVQPYLEFVLQSYRSLPASIQNNFRFPTDLDVNMVANAPAPSPDTPAAAKKDGDDKEKEKKTMTVAKTPPVTALSPSGGIPTTPRPRLAPRSSASFRVLTECPLTVMLLFQLHPRFLKANIPQMVQLMIEALGLRAPPLQALESANSSIKRLYHSRSRELIATQVKTLSFLTQFLKGFAELLKPYQDQIAGNVVALMTICPPESIGTRRELLHATRHILATDFRKGFFRHIDSLLDERVLMGPHPKSSDQAVLRPLGYSTLADLVHHARSLLSMKQLSRIVYIFSRVIHDSSLKLPLAIQTTAVRLLLNLVDTVFHNKDANPQLGRDLLARILDSLVRKLGVLKDYIPLVEVTEQARSVETTDLEAAVLWTKSLNDGSETSDLTDDSAKSKEDKTTRKLWSQDDSSDVTDTLQDVQTMVRSIVVGLKTVVWCINNYSHQREKEKLQHFSIPAGSNEEVSSAMHKLTNWEYGLIDKYITYALPCFRVFNQVYTDSKQASKHATPESIIVANQYRDVLTYFAAAFTMLDSYNFRRTIGARVDLLVETVEEDHPAMLIPRHLLGSNQKASFVFVNILLSYLVEHMEELSTNDTDQYVFLDRKVEADNMEDFVSKETVTEAFQRIKGPQEARRKRASTLLELFERALKSLVTFPDNEAALRPYLRQIISWCLRSTVERSEGWPDNNCILLRYTFRAISAGKFEESYKELLPLLPTILNGLYRIFLATEDTNLRHVIIELCLTVPARLSSLLPHMSLLLRMIIHALNSNTGDLVNLGLRTLEFWVDNLNPDFLYPIISKQTDSLTELMTALSNHLRPAPYPYGLLTLRLLGKLGGKNRCFLREPLDLTPFPQENSVLSLPCDWPAVGDESVKEGEDETTKSGRCASVAGGEDEVRIELPLQRAVEIIQLIAMSSDDDDIDPDQKEGGTTGDSETGVKLKWNEFKKLRTTEPDQVDIRAYCAEVVAETKRQQAEAALCVVLSILANILDLEEAAPENAVGSCLDSTSNVQVAGGEGLESDTVTQRRSSSAQKVRTKTLRTICEGLMYACAIGPIKEEATIEFKGFISYLFLLVKSLSEHIKKIDSYGSQVSSDDDDAMGESGSKADEEDSGGSYPLGCFLLTGPFIGRADPLVLNESIAQVLRGPSINAHKVALDAIRSLVNMSLEASKASGKSGASDSLDECDVFFESLISALFQATLSTPWNSRTGLYDGIFLVMDGLGRKWSDRFEVEAMHVAILGLKTAPKDIPVAAVLAFQFFSGVCDRLYTSSTLSYSTVDGFVTDPLTAMSRKDDDADDKKSAANYASPSEGVVSMLVGELTSMKQIVRFAVRYAIKLYMVDSMPKKELEGLLSAHMSTIKRLLFARSLRLLPLSEQVGVFDALAFLIQEVPSLVPLSDQHLLASLSEFLKMASIGDGEMKDANMSGYVVDKNGFVASAQDRESQVTNQLSTHTCDVFLRRECAVKSPSEGSYVIIPEDVPPGVQLRVSGLRLFRAVIRQHTDEFFDADSATPVGNIRPHVISLLFRSLISRPTTAVVVAHLTLRDVLALSTSSSAEGEKDKDTKTQSRLPKELLQTCIRPVLLNLRDYTRLNVPLLQGLARLLSLLSSWFNTTLGEKLLEHLQKWTDPERIVSRNLWIGGEEPLVAAAILDLFALLPQASHFVERLVKTTIKLEISLPAFKPKKVASPYRQPLARYLNKHPQYAVSFFFQRLKTPVYSELFQDIVSYAESKPLRDYISGPQCSASFLNICFERPLGIIRADQTSSSKASTPNKTATSPSVPEILALHGIMTAPALMKKDMGGGFQEELEKKQKRVQAAQKELARIEEQLKARLAAKGVGPESHVALEETRLQQKAAQSALDKAVKDLNDSKQQYASEIAQPTSEVSSKGDDKATDEATSRPMDIEALELQRQGLELVMTLVANDKNYINEHSDVVKAFRWLWRSKGRYLRLQHEEFIPPRYHDESTMLARFLISTATAFPKDVDILYELLRIFLQPATSDFSFVHKFLADTMAHKLTIEQKRNLLARLVALLAAEGKEETKALSIQHIAIPILLSSLLEDSEIAQERESARRADKSKEEEKEGKGDDETVTTVVNQDIVTQFAVNVLFTDGMPAVCGDQLRTELLRFSTLLLERADELLVPHRKDVIKFSWSLLKSDDSNCKNWASLNLCRFISVFETPPKNILQVYVALLRSYQQEGKELVRLALAILVPLLPERLPPNDIEKMIDSTIKVMYEEGNSAPQLAHVLHTVVTHINAFHDYRQRFVRHMINSLNRLGLPPNCPIENRFLAIAIVELVLLWGGHSELGTTDVMSSVGTKRKEASSDYQDASVEGNKRKKTKTEKREIETSIESSGMALLDVDMVETIANFLVRLRILLADSKIEVNSRYLENETTRLLDAVISKWGDIAIRPIYFEKVVSMCVNETAANKQTVPGADTRAREKGILTGPDRNTGKAGTSKSDPNPPPAGVDEARISSSLLSACLDVFVTMARSAPQNPFLKENCDKIIAILGPCFARLTRHDGEKGIQSQLKEFLLPILAGTNQQFLDDTAMVRVQVLLETLMLEAVGSDFLQQPAASSPQKGTRERSSRDEKGPGASSLAYFSVELIEKASGSRPEIVGTFSNGLLTLAEKLCSKHLEDATSNQRQGSLYPKQGVHKSFRQKFPTPISGILEMTCSVTSIPDITSSAAKSSVATVEAGWLRQVPEIGTALRSLTTSLRLLGSSDILFTFNESRAKLLRIICSILDSSDNVQLIMTAYSIVGDWLLAGRRSGPLTTSERMVFLKKLASYDSNGFSDVAMQPIADLVADIVMEMYEAFPKGSEASDVEFGHEEDIPLARALLACSINANPQIRALILGIYSRYSEGKEGSNWSQDCSPLQMLRQLLNSDLNGLGSRMWTVMFVEVLLAGCRPRCIDSSPDHRRDAWLPQPCKKRLAKSSVNALADAAAVFRTSLTHGNKGRLYSAVSTLAHGDFPICQNLFVSLLSAAWIQLPSDECRLSLLPALEALLALPNHSQFIRVPRLTNLGGKVAEQYPRGINAVRSFINAMLRFRPLPVIDGNILAIVGGKYNCWHEVLTLLENQYDILSGNSLGERGEQLKDSTLAAIRRGYRLLEENKLGLALAAKSCVLPETKYAVSLDMFDMVKEALDSYSALVDLLEATDQERTAEPTNFEMDLWEERWVALQGEMCQLPIVKDYATSRGDSLLLLNCAWKTQDWDRVRSLCSSSALLSTIEDGDPGVKLDEIMLAINEGKLGDVESLHVQTAQLCLQKWQLLPDLTTGSLSHALLLHAFHRLVELRESGQIMIETSNHSKRRTLPDLKNLLSAWRHRLPNDFESLLKWEDIFVWRTHMFSAITSNFQWSEAGTLATLHDRPWTAIRMAKTARKQNLRGVSLMSLNKITDSTMDVSDAFGKLREQILCYDNPDSDIERTGGLNLVNTTNLSYFQPSQKSELFRLKAHFLESLAGRSKANRAYCHAVQICPSYSRAWGSWGGLCSSLGKLAERQHEIELLKAENGEPLEKDKSATSAKKVAQYLAQAMGCYFESVDCYPSEFSRVHLPKCLWMLAKDGSSPGILCQTLETRGVPLPSWVWLPWILQLLTSLYRTEGRAVKSVLNRIGKAYPQALYYSLRAFYLERRDVERSRGSTPASGSQQQGSAAYAEELMSLLRRSHAALWSSLEGILEELIVKFKPSFDEELLVYIAGILDRAESLVDRKSLKTDDGGDEETIIASIEKNVMRISTKFFCVPAPESPAKNDDRSRKTSEFRRKYKDMFEADFQVEKDDKESKGEAEKLTLSDYLVRLKKWRRLLEDQVSSTPLTLPLIESSPSLALFASEAPDLWSGSCDPRHRDAASTNREKIDPDGSQSGSSSSFMAATTAAALAAQVVANTAVSEGGGGDFGGGSAAIEIPGQYFPNRTSSQDSKPCPELHVKLIRFESTVQVVRRNEQLIRKIGMVGSDGKTHHFSLQWALPYWTRTEERTAQLFFLIDRVLRRGVQSSRNYLSAQPTAVVPIAQRLRITAEDSSRNSLDQVFRRWCEARGEDYEAASKCFHDELLKQLEAAKGLELADDDTKTIAEEDARYQALKKVSETCVDKNMLLEFMHEQLDGPEQLFHFRRNYAGQLATDALMQHACCVVERTPSRVVFLQRNGHILTPDYRFEYNNHGFLDPRKTPFRMTPNIQSMIGQLLLEGRFIPSMGAVASALEDADDDLEPALRLLLRDDIVAWYTSKSMAKSDAKMQELEKQLLDRVIRNAISVQSRIAECAPRVPKTEDGKSETLRKEPVDLKVRELVKEATDPRRLCMMPSNYQAWL